MIGHGRRQAWNASGRVRRSNRREAMTPDQADRSTVRPNAVAACGPGAQPDSGPAPPGVVNQSAAVRLAPDVGLHPVIDPARSATQPEGDSNNSSSGVLTLRQNVITCTYEARRCGAAGRTAMIEPLKKSIGPQGMIRFSLQGSDRRFIGDGDWRIDAAATRHPNAGRGSRLLVGSGI